MNGFFVCRFFIPRLGGAGERESFLVSISCLMMMMMMHTPLPSMHSRKKRGDAALRAILCNVCVFFCCCWLQWIGTSTTFRDLQVSIGKSVLGAWKWNTHAHKNLIRVRQKCTRLLMRCCAMCAQKRKSKRNVSCEGGEFPSRSMFPDSFLAWCAAQKCNYTLFRCTIPMRGCVAVGATLVSIPFYRWNFRLSLVFLLNWAAACNRYDYFVRFCVACCVGYGYRILY